jgi:hypothetical protein
MRRPVERAAKIEQQSGNRGHKMPSLPAGVTVLQFYFSLTEISFETKKILAS